MITQGAKYRSSSLNLNAFRTCVFCRWLFFGMAAPSWPAFRHHPQCVYTKWYMQGICEVHVCNCGHARHSELSEAWDKYETTKSAWHVPNVCVFEQVSCWRETTKSSQRQARPHDDDDVRSETTTKNIHFWCRRAEWCKPSTHMTLAVIYIDVHVWCSDRSWGLGFEWQTHVDDWRRYGMEICVAVRCGSGDGEGRRRIQRTAMALMNELHVRFSGCLRLVMGIRSFEWFMIIVWE